MNHKTAYIRFRMSRSAIDQMVMLRMAFYSMNEAFESAMFDQSKERKPVIQKVDIQGGNIYNCSLRVNSTE